MTTLFLGQLSMMKASHAERCGAAAATGFHGVSLFWSTLLAARDAGRPDKLFREEADAHGLRIVQLEFAVPSPDHAAFGAIAQEMAKTAALLGCDAVHAVALDRRAHFADIVISLRLLADACAAYALRCGLEFVPFLSAVETLPAALEVIRATDRPNLGLVLDVLHFQRGGAQWDALASMAPSEVTTLQLNDGPLAMPVEDYAIEAMALRLLPGDGAIDLPRIMATLSKIGWNKPITIEVASNMLDALPPHEAARRMAEATRALLSAGS